MGIPSGERGGVPGVPGGISGGGVTEPAAGLPVTARKSAGVEQAVPQPVVQRPQVGLQPESTVVSPARMADHSTGGPRPDASAAVSTAGVTGPKDIFQVVMDTDRTEPAGDHPDPQQNSPAIDQADPSSREPRRQANTAFPAADGHDTDITKTGVDDLDRQASEFEKILGKCNDGVHTLPSIVLGEYGIMVIENRTVDVTALDTEVEAERDAYRDTNQRVINAAREAAPDIKKVFAPRNGAETTGLGAEHTIAIDRLPIGSPNQIDALLGNQYAKALYVVDKLEYGYSYSGVMQEIRLGAALQWDITTIQRGQISSVTYLDRQGKSVDRAELDKEDTSPAGIKITFTTPDGKERIHEQYSVPDLDAMPEHIKTQLTQRQFDALYLRATESLVTQQASFPEYQFYVAGVRPGGIVVSDSREEDLKWHMENIFSHRSIVELGDNEDFGYAGPNAKVVTATPEVVAQGHINILEIAGASMETQSDTAEPADQPGEQVVIAKDDAEHVNTGITIDRTNKTAKLIEDEIQASEDKRIPYSRFMEISLFGPEGYYSTGKAEIKPNGDFATNALLEPFNQTVGNSYLKVWEAMGRPDTFHVVEMGAGTAMMAKDILVWAKDTNPEFYKALKYIIVEYGDMREKQQATIGSDKHEDVYRQRQLTPEENKQDLEKVTWVQGSAFALPLQNIEGVIASNELPDTAPIDKAKLINGEIRQKYVTLENDHWTEVWGELSPEVKEYIEKYNIPIPDNGSEIAINSNAAKWQHTIDKALKRGAIFTIDYGRNGTMGEVYPNHNAVRTYPIVTVSPDAYYQDPDRHYIYMNDISIQFRKKYQEYAKPGNYDITSDVDFAVLEAIARDDKLAVAFSGGEEEFLLRNGYDKFFYPSLEYLQKLQSVKELTTLYSMLALNINHSEHDAFYTQVLTKGIDLAIPEAVYPSIESFKDIGFKLQVGNPNATVTVEINNRGNIHTIETKLDTDGNLHFDGTELNPTMPYSPAIQCIVRDGDVVLLDTKDKYAVKDATERSGYTFDYTLQPRKVDAQSATNEPSKSAGEQTD